MSRGPAYEQEDPIWHAWAEICDLYFPKIAANATAPRWSVDRGVPRPSRSTNGVKRAPKKRRRIDDVGLGSDDEDDDGNTDEDDEPDNVSRLTSDIPPEMFDVSAPNVRPY